MIQVDTNDLGQLTGILAVDVRRFSRHNDIQQKQIGTLLPVVLHEAAERAGLDEIMRSTVFHAFRGDGYLIGFDPGRVTDVVDRYFDSLQAVLRCRSPELRAAEIELRLRVSLHLGPLQSFDKLVADSPTGRVMVESGRMVDADPVRALLDHSDPNVTLVAAVLSEEVMKNVIEAGRTARRPSEFVAAPLRIDAKDYSGTGYLRVPVPSGDLLRYGLLYGQPEQATDDEQDSEERSTRSEGAGGNTFNGSAPNARQIGYVSGGFSDNSVQNIVSGDSVHNSVSGNGNNIAGGDINTAPHTVVDQVYSGFFNTRGDSNFGPSSGRRINESGVAEGR